MNEWQSDDGAPESSADERDFSFNRSLSRRAVLGAGLGAALALPSVVRAATREPSRTHAPVGGFSGGTIRIARPPTNPAESLDPGPPLTAYDFLGAIYNRLVKRGPGGRPIPDLATAWTTSKDAKTWTFKLRQNVTFHNGKTFTSKDVAYTFAHLLDPAVNSPQAPVLSPLISANSIVTPDDHTIIFRLKAPDAEFVSLLMHFNCYIIPDGSAATIGTTGIGTGPFKLISFKSAQNGTLAANADYFGGRPNLDGIQFFAIPDAQARVNALLAGQVDLVSQTNLGFAEARAVKANPSTTVASVKNAYWYVLPMLTTLKPFTDVRVRQAFKLAYNPSDVLQVAVHGFGTPAYNNPIAPDDSYRIKAHEGQDVDKAKFLLRQAGYSNGIDVTLYTSDSDPVLTPLALAYQASVKKAGIRANVSNQPSDSYFTKIWIQKPLCSSYWYSGPPADQLLNQVFRSGSSYNETKWKNVQFERLLDRARRETNYAKRRAIYQDVQTLLVAQSGTIIPFFADRLTGLSRKVRNYHEVGFEFDYLHLALAG